MSSELRSRAQLDRLGERLRDGPVSDEDLRLLGEYRRSFRSAYETVVARIRGELGLEPTGRPAKTTGSITDKLRRESIRLTQIQDIAGCRLIVKSIAQQNQVVSLLTTCFPGASVIDRRQTPSHGYRAVHVVARAGAQSVEIQVRTARQQLWAEISEKLSDLVAPGIKYGKGPAAIQKTLTHLARLVSEFEAGEGAIEALQKSATSVMADPPVSAERAAEIERLIQQQAEASAALESQLDELLQDMLARLRDGDASDWTS